MDRSSESGETSPAGSAPFAASTQGVEVSVVPVYLPEQSDPAQARHVWAYTVTIENGGSQTVQLRERTWRIIDANGVVEHVRGPGVVGEQPVLRPGERFEYTSGCPLSTPSGIMEGHYTMMRENGETFEATIPTFSLDRPDERRVLN